MFMWHIGYLMLNKYKMGLIHFVLYVPEPAHSLYPAGLSIGIVLQYPMDMGMGMDINFENGYGWGYG